MPRTHYKEKSKCGRIDLTDVGRYEIIVPAITHKDQWLKEKFPEAVILDTLPPLEVPLPRFSPSTRATVSIWGAMKKELLALRP